MNFDGTLSTTKQKASMWIVVPKSKGDCLNIRAKQNSICSSLMVESKVTLLRLHTTISIGVTKLMVEGDSKVVIETMKESLEECPNEIRNCIQDCKELFKAFDHIFLQHVIRSKNKVKF